MDLTNSFVVPFSKFKTDFINSRAFIGTCSFRDVCHFMFVHRYVYTYVLWIDSETKRMCISFCSFNLLERKLEINMIEIVMQSFSFNYDNLESDEIYHCISLNDIELSCSIYFHHWFPSEISTLNSLFGRILKSDKMKHHFMIIFSIQIPSQCLFSKCIPYDKKIHECNKYDKGDVYSSETCSDENFSPDSLKMICLFFVGNYFHNSSVINECLPSCLVNEIANVQPCIGKTDKLKNKKKIIRMSFDKILYRKERINFSKIYHDKFKKFWTN